MLKELWPLTFHNVKTFRLFSHFNDEVECLLRSTTAACFIVAVAPVGWSLGIRKCLCSNYPPPTVYTLLLIINTIIIKIINQLIAYFLFISCTARSVLLCFFNVLFYFNSLYKGLALWISLLQINLSGFCDEAAHLLPWKIKTTPPSDRKLKG